MKPNAVGKIKAGITIGDINGIGPEIIIKTFDDNRLFNYCTPIIYGSTKVLSYYRKILQANSFNYQQLKQFKLLNPKTVNVVNCIAESLIIYVGMPSKKSGEYCLQAIDRAIEDFKNGLIDVLITAPVDKSVVAENLPEFTGHTEYIANKFGIDDCLMLMVSDNLRIGLATNHLPVNRVPKAISIKSVFSKLQLMNSALKKDFSIDKPKIAVLSLNPHAGDKGLLGKDETEHIIPALQKAQENAILALGPYAADSFFGKAHFNKFDGILAMYHDQGLVPFKTLAFGGGTNFTAGLPIVRTSPDHGPAFDIAGKGIASENSFRDAVFTAIDIFKCRKKYEEMTANPVKNFAIAEKEKN